MTADDTSRDALIERVARVLDVEGAFCGECDNEPGGFYDECSQCRRFLTGYATAVVDAVVMPLVQERDAWHERWRQLMRDYEALVREREAAEAEGDRSWSAK